MDNKNSMQNAKVKRIFDFNFSTIMLFRCTRRKFAQSFKEGKIYFNQPKNWIKEEINGNKGRGDILEGTFMAVYKDETKMEEIKGKDISFVDYRDLRHFRNKRIENLYSLCFYGLYDNVFNKKTIDKEGKSHYMSYVKKEYFSDFSDDVTKETYSSINELEQPVVLFINNTHKLFEKIKQTLIKIGVKEKDIIISPIEYINKEEPYISAVQFPKELLLKDIYYSEQKELRIIINSDNNIFKNYMNENNNTIDIGNIEDIVEIYDYYFNDLVIEKTGKNSIMFNLPFPVYENFDDMELDCLIKILIQINKKIVPIEEVNGYNEDKKNLEKYIEGIIKEKYKIDVHYDEDKLFIYDPYNLWNEYIKKYWITNFIESKVNSFIEQGHYEFAFNEINTISKNKEEKFPVDYYIGKIFEKNENYLEAIEKYSYCIENEEKIREALASRAICYTKLKRDKLALEDWNRLQEIVGYNYEIYANKGLNFIQLGKLNDAIKEFDKSIQMAEENSFAYYNRSVAHYITKNYIQAQEDIQKAIKYNPENKFYKQQYEKYYKNL